MINFEMTMEDVVKTLNEASDAYYNGREIMSNYEFDALYDVLIAMEADTGIALPDSPTKKVGYEVRSALEKSEHRVPALSLDKTKERASFVDWLGDQEGVLSYKMDGLTVVVTYDGGILVSAVTRGNGVIGEVVTHNARFFKGLPKQIEDKRHIELRGEAHITYSDFNFVNLLAEEPYKNPRNLASGAVRQLDAKVSAAKKVSFRAFELVNATELGIKTYAEAFEILKALGIAVVPYWVVDKDRVVEVIDTLEDLVKEDQIPTDGLVVCYNDIAYGQSLGTTGKFPRSGKAFKWADETMKTTLRRVEWSPSRTGLINPVAVFDPVELEGTTVTRASVHNISQIRKLQLGIGDTVSVFKANMIIPQIAENQTCSDTLEIPDICPVCGAKTERRMGQDEAEFLYCPNESCPAKQVGKYEHFVGRDYMNIEGLSTATLELILDLGIVHEYRDLYHIQEHRAVLEEQEGMGAKSVQKLFDSIEKSRTVKFASLFAALGIPAAGRDAGKILGRVLTNPDKGTKIEQLLGLVKEGADSFTAFDGIGPVMAENIVGWFKENETEFLNLVAELTITDNEVDAACSQQNSSLPFEGIVFVITGSLETYGNRKDLVAEIESLGGKCSGSVSKKTHYLINNDATSESSKNKKAKEVGTKVITEAQYKEMAATGKLI